MQKIKTNLTNAFIFSIVFLVSLSIATLAIARRTNEYRSTSREYTFSVEKDEVKIVNPVGGRIERMLVSPGQIVTKGETIAELRDEQFESRLNTLTQFADENLSARTEAELLRNSRNLFKVTAPRDGIINTVDVSVGTLLTPNQTLATLYANTDVKLIANVTGVKLTEVQKVKSLEAISPRIGVSYEIEYAGIRKVSAVDTTGTTYEVIFRFKNADDGSGLLNGEQLEVLSLANDVKRPSEIVADIWNSLIVKQ